MAPASGETDPCGFWEEHWSGLRLENVRGYWSWFRDLGANGVGTSVGRTGQELSRLARGRVRRWAVGRVWPQRVGDFVYRMAF